MIKEIKHFIYNYNMYNKTKIWRERKRGLLKPFIPKDRLWAGISINFIIGLFLSKNNKIINIMIITYWLLKNIILKPLKDLKIKTII